MQKKNFLCFYLVVSKYYCIFAAEIKTKRINNKKILIDYEEISYHLRNKKISRQGK